MSSLAVPLSSTATEECEKVERESLASTVSDHIRRQVHYVLDQSEVELSQLMETQEKLKGGSKELNRKLQNVEDEQVRGRGMVMTVT